MAGFDAVLGQVGDVLVELRPQLRGQAIDPQSSLFEGGLGFDSIVIIELIELLESSFEILIDESDLRVGNFANVEAVARLVMRGLEKEGR